jgi:hypothetical protein
LAILEYGESKVSVVALIHPPVEDLMEHIVDDIMEKVVPRETKEEVLHDKGTG